MAGQWVAAPQGGASRGQHGVCWRTHRGGAPSGRWHAVGGWRWRAASGGAVPGSGELPLEVAKGAHSSSRWVGRVQGEVECRSGQSRRLKCFCGTCVGREGRGYDYCPPHCWSILVHLAMSLPSTFARIWYSN
jgi:hypothetical protein